MIPFSRSLNAKLLLIVIVFVSLCGFAMAWYQAALIREQVKVRFDQTLERMAAQASDQISNSLSERIKILNQVKLSYLNHQADLLGASLTGAAKLQRDPDGAIRIVEPHSGVFVPEDVAITQDLRRWIHHNRSLWDNLSSVLSGSFDSFYFVRNDGVGRASPVDIAINHDAGYDLREESFFSNAAPHNNPEQQTQRSDMYFSSYSQSWRIGLSTPIYVHQEFLGVLGAEINLPTILQPLTNIQTLSPDGGAIVFDHSKRLIALQVTQGDMTSLAHLQPRTEPEVLNLIKNAYPNSSSLGEITSQTFLGQKVWMIHLPITGFQWGVILFYPDQLITERLKETSQNIYVTLFLLVILVTLTIYTSLRFFVSSPIASLANAMEKVGDGNWRVQLPALRNDEIGILGQGISSMLSKINELIDGFSGKIIELEQANLEAAKLITAIEHSSSVVVIFNEQWQVEYANRYFWEVSEYEPGSHLNAAQGLLLLKEDDISSVIEDITKTLVLDDEWRKEYQACRSGGENFWLMQSVSQVQSQSGQVQFYIAAAQDVTHIKNSAEQMQQLAYYDQLTGLQNRVLFKSQLELAIKSCIREGSQVALMYLDLDHFKRINDTLGHEAGDLLLIEVADRLRRCLREEDAVARLGGDEFAVLINRIGSPQYASIVANKIISALNKPHLIDGQEVLTGTSIGITLAPYDSGDIETLMKNADMAMYQAKERGRNSFQFFTSDMNEEVLKRLKIERELRQALIRNQFELHFQPQVDFKTGEIVAAEALIRWRHPDRGMISPLDFIPVAEETGLIVEIGKWCLRSACQQARSIYKALHRPIKISVNLSVRQLRESNFVEELKAVLEETRLSPSFLELEITESLLMSGGGQIDNMLQAIRDLGVELAIDDFGTGYSSLSYLKRLPVSTLKIDRSFIKDLPDDQEDREITGLIVALANNLRYKVVVEGVETWAQVDYLLGSGCDLCQGFYFSKPVPSSELMVLLFQWDAQRALSEGFKSA